MTVTASATAEHLDSVASLGRALRRLAQHETTTGLVEAIPRHTASLGYRRTLFSWLEHQHWVPRSAHIDDEPARAAALVAAGADPSYLNPRLLLEADVVQHGRTIRVDVTDTRRIHPQLFAITHSTSYVAGPVTVGSGRVAALLHVDQPRRGGEMTEADRELIEVLCQALGTMLELTQLHEQITRRHDELEHHWQAIRGLMNDFGAATEPHDSGMADTAIEEAVWQKVTRRELQVLALVAEGLTNSQIGERLFITEDTVKSHIKNTMRKLAVSTRTEAGAALLRRRSTTRPGQEPPPFV